MEKQIALGILEEIQQSILNNKDKEAVYKVIRIYKKNLQLSTNQRIKQLIIKHKAYVEKFGEESPKVLRLGKKIDKEICKIFNC